MIFASIDQQEEFVSRDKKPSAAALPHIVSALKTLGRRSASPIRVRRAEVGEASDLAQVQLRGWASVHRSLFPNRPIPSLSYPSRVACWTKRLREATPADVALVVLDSTGIITGFAYAQATGADAEIRCLYCVDDPDLRAAKMLFRRVALALIESGAKRLKVGTFAQCDLARICEFFGGTIEDRVLVKREGRSLTKSLYRWTDLRRDARVFGWMNPEN
ncbi:MAG: hypothetical protein N2C14_03815 [Planctomycetales bacterium]